MALAALAAAAILPAGAQAANEPDQEGAVRAVLSWSKPDQDRFGASEVTLRIYHSDVLAYTKEIKPPCKGCLMEPIGQGKRGKAVRVRNLDGDKAPEVLVDLYTGGAHCCSWAIAFDRRGADYMSYRHNFRDSGYRLHDRNDDGFVEFRTTDARFAYLYDCFACSFFPAQLFILRDGFTNVTTEFPKLVLRQALDLRELYHERKGESNVRAILAAYVADRCNLGDCGDGIRLVRRALRKGYLDRQGEADLIKPYGRKYVRSLKRVLDDLGYR